MGGSVPTFASFKSSLDPLNQNNAATATQVTTERAQVEVSGPAQDSIPPGIELNFSIKRSGTFFPAISLGVVNPTTFTVDIASGAGTLEQIRYTGAAPTWFNVLGGQLLAFDVTLPFP